MDFNVTTRYAAKREHNTHKYSAFHSGTLGVMMHGYSSDEVVKVELTVVDHAEDYEQGEDESEIYTGVYTFDKGKTDFVYSHILATKMCSPCFFKNDIESGEAIFVKLKVKEIKND